MWQIEIHDVPSVGPSIQRLAATLGPCDTKVAITRHYTHMGSAKCIHILSVSTVTQWGEKSDLYFSDEKIWGLQEAYA